MHRFFPLLAAVLALGLASRPRADERMNGMVGLYYSSDDLVAFEYDLIAQFRKSKEWMGNISGPFVSEEASYRSNRLGTGLVVGKRGDLNGTYAASVSVFEENRWGDFTTVHTGAEAKICLMVLGVKVGVLDWDTRYFEIGFSY
jgi:hypothetical protein